MKYFLQGVGATVSIILSILVLTGSVPGSVLAIWVLGTWGLVLLILLFLGAMFVIASIIGDN